MATSKLVKVPVTVYGVGGRYVSALFSAASKKKKLEVVEKDLQKLAALYKEQPKFKEFMVSPLIEPFEKNQVFEKSLKPKLGLDELSVNLLSAMAENRRLKFLPDVESSYASIMSNIRNELPVTITSAKPLPDAKKKEVEEAIKSFSSKKLIIEYTVDPGIVGGLVVDFNGEHYVDMSVKSRMRLFTESLKQV